MSSAIQIDVTTLSEEQLTALALICPDTAAAERERRSAFPTLADGLGALAQAALNLEQALEGHRQTAATKAVKDTEILSIIRRLLARARIDGVEVPRPTLQVGHA